MCFAFYVCIYLFIIFKNVIVKHKKSNYAHLIFQYYTHIFCTQLSEEGMFFVCFCVRKREGERKKESTAVFLFEGSMGVCDAVGECWMKECRRF